MNKTLISILAIAPFVLMGCSNDNFISSNEFKSDYSTSVIQDEEKKNAYEKKEAENLSNYYLANASSGVYSLCMRGFKNYAVFSQGETTVSMAMDLNEDPIPCANEGKFINILNNLSYGIRTYCSEEKILYQLITSQSYQFYPMRDLKFKLISCERK